MRYFNIRKLGLRAAALLLSILMLLPLMSCDMLDILAEELQQAASMTESAAPDRTIPSQDDKGDVPAEDAPTLDEDGVYDQKDDVALYIYLYGKLPNNFITKKEAQKLGWEGGTVEKYAPGCCIGGDYFGNYEGILPKKKGRSYYECDIDTLGKRSRGAKRIIFSNDGLIYYTEDHYESFTLLYGEE